MRLNSARSILNVAAAGVAVVLAGALAGAAQQPTFRASVDLIAVDVQVMDSTGRPISGLDPGKFEVTIDGRRRRVISADFISAGTAGTPGPNRPTAAGPLATNAPPVGAKPGRVFVMAIDAGSFESGDTIPVIQAARGFIDRLEPEDLVGVFTMPPFGPRADPTSDRTPVRQALNAISGQRQSIQGQFNLSTSEIVDIMAGTGGLGSPLGRSPTQGTPAGTGALAPAADFDALARVQLRECRQTTDMACLESIINEAAALASHLEERVTQGLNGIIALLDALQRLPQRKTVVVISAGMPVSDRPGGRIDIGEEAKQLGEQAARANAIVYALHIDLGLSRAFSAQARRARDAGSVARDSRVSSRLLEEFASASGGSLIPVKVGAGENALDRVLLEASGYYVLGVEPTDTDRDGRVHRLAVKTAQRGATIRSRQWVMAGTRER